MGLSDVLCVALYLSSIPCEWKVMMVIENLDAIYPWVMSLGSTVLRSKNQSRSPGFAVLR